MKHSKKVWMAAVLVTMLTVGCSGGAKEPAAQQPAQTTAAAAEKETAAKTEEQQSETSGAAEAAAGTLTKAADGFPNKDMTLILDSDPGTETYNIMAKFAEIASRYAEVKINLESYEGSSGVLALNELMKAEADGYTMLHQSLTLPLTIGFQTAPFKTEQIQPIAGLYGDSLVVSVLPDSEFQSIDDIVKYARENPGKFNWGGAKTKAAIQVGSAMFWDCADIDVNYIAYPSGNDALVAVLGGNTMCNASSVSGAFDYYKNGELKILAVSAPGRLESIPEVPTFEELGYPEMSGYSIYRGSYTLAGVPQEHLDVLEELHKLVAEDTEWKEFLKSINKEEDFRGTEDYTKWYHEIVDFTSSFEF